MKGEGRGMRGVILVDFMLNSSSPTLNPHPFPFLAIKLLLNLKEGAV
jgi:hypothetical protein